MNKRLIIVSGPSGVGKGPIIEWTKRIYVPDLCQVKVRKTRTERCKGIEDDLRFEGLSDNTYEFDCRGTRQVIDLDELDQALERENKVLLETYYRTFDFLKERYRNSVDFVSAFISPLDEDGIKELAEQGKRLEDYLPDLMLNSLIRRAERHEKAFTRTLMRELELRAEDSVNEVKFAHNYRHVIPNHCYESDSRWKFSFLIGEPLRVVRALNDIIKEGYCNYAIKGSDYRFPTNKDS